MISGVDRRRDRGDRAPAADRGAHRHQQRGIPLGAEQPAQRQADAHRQCDPDYRVEEAVHARTADFDEVHSCAEPDH